MALPSVARRILLGALERTTKGTEQSLWFRFSIDSVAASRPTDGYFHIYNCV